MFIYNMKICILKQFLAVSISFPNNILKNKLIFTEKIPFGTNNLITGFDSSFKICLSFLLNNSIIPKKVKKVHEKK